MKFVFLGKGKEAMFALIYRILNERRNESKNELDTVCAGRLNGKCCVK